MSMTIKEFLERVDCVTIEVTQEDIDKGLPCDPCECPIAIATHRALELDEEDSGLIAVEEDYIDLLGLQYDLPDEALRFVRTFDRYWSDEEMTLKEYNEEVKPFSFTLTEGY